MNEELKGQESVTMDFSCLTTNNLTADLYLILHWKYNSNYELPKPIREHSIENMDALDYLQEREFIKITGEEGEFELRQKGISLFETKTPVKKWLEFLGTFPIKVPSQNGGSRPLKVASPDSKANDKPKAKYLALIKNKPQMHEHIMSVLKAEMKMRKDSSNLQYMNALEAWLNQANYDKYSYLLEEQVKEEYKDEDYM